MIGGNLPTWKTGLPPWQRCDRLSFHVLSGGGKFSEGGLLYTGPVHFPCDQEPRTWKWCVSCFEMTSKTGIGIAL